MPLRINCFCISFTSGSYFSASAIAPIAAAAPMAHMTAKLPAVVNAAAVASDIIVPVIAATAGAAVPKENTLATIEAAKATASPTYVSTFVTSTTARLDASLYYFPVGNIFSEINTSIPLFFRELVIENIVLLAIPSHEVSLINSSATIVKSLKCQGITPLVA